MPPPFWSVRVKRKRGSEIALHSHDESQLIYAASGTMQVHTTTGRWLVPPSLAVWIPTSVPHRVEIVTHAELWLISWIPRATAEWAPPGLVDRAFALRVTTFLRELLNAVSAADTSSIRTELAVRLILQELTAAVEAPTYLPLPSSGIGRRIADRVLSDPGHQRRLDDIAFAAGSAPRTVSRLSPAETGLTFKAWRQRARIVFSIERLAAGVSVQRVAREVGFANATAFAYAFRQVTMMTPTEFQRKNVRLGHPA